MNASRIAAIAVAALAAALSVLPAHAQSARRAGTGEIYLAPVFTDGKNYSSDGGSAARTDTGYGLTFGYAYNFDAHKSLGFEFGWGSQDYRATITPGPGNLV